MKVDKKYLKKTIKEILSKTDKSEENLLKISSILDVLHKLFKENLIFRNIVLNPKLPVEDKEKAIIKLMSSLNAPQELTEIIFNVIKDKKGSILKEINKVFKFEVEKFFGTVQGEIISAYKIDEEMLNQIKTIIESRIGKKVEFKVREDKSLIGGAIIKAGSYIVDASIKSYLSKLEKTLSRF